MNKGNLDHQLKKVGKIFISLRFILFLILAAGVYGFLIWRINTLRNAEPSQAATTSQSSTTTHIDQATVNKISQLQDNSVNVQALFDQARQNPFQE